MKHIVLRGLLAVPAVLIALSGTGAAFGQTWIEGTGGSGDAGQNGVGAAQHTVGSGPLTLIQGSLTSFGDVDIYCIDITDHAHFRAFCAGFGGDSVLWLFNSSGTLQEWNNDASPVTQDADIGAQGVLSDGEYYLAFSAFHLDPRDATDASLALTTNWPGPMYQQHQGTAGILDHWATLGSGPTNGPYNIALIGASFCPTPGAAVVLGLGTAPLVRRRRR